MNNKTSLFSSFAWKFAERMLSQGIGLIIQIFIARMIKPEAVGEMAIILSVINIFSVIAQSGFSSYIIQKQELKKKTIATVTTFSILISFICIIAFWLVGDRFMSFLGYPELGIYLKISGIILIFQSINGVCMGLLSKEMQFKEMFIRTLIVLPISSLVCFSVMFLGYDLGALLAYNIANPCCTTVFMISLLYKKGYKLEFGIDFKELKTALPYSLRVLTQDIGNVLTNSIRSFMMGGFYSANQLAYYDRAFTYTSYVEESITYTASSVLLPAMAKEQNNKTKLNNYIINATAIYSLIIIPALLGFAAIAPTFTKLILTEKWLPCVPYIYVFAIGFLHYPILTIQRPAFLATGRSDVTMKITIVQNIISIVVLIVTVKFSTLWIAVGTSIALLMYIPLYVFATKKYMCISVKKQVGAMIKYMIYAVIMGSIVFPINWMNSADIVKIIIQVTLGMIVYLALLLVTKDKLFLQIINLVKEKVRRKAV